MVVLYGLTTTVYSRQPVAEPYGPVYTAAYDRQPINFYAGAPAAAYAGAPAAAFAGAPAAAYAGAPAAAYRSFPEKLSPLYEEDWAYYDTPEVWGFVFIC